jgi:ADP-ribosylglycohydrolase
MARGSMLASAIGDALGAPVEFWSLAEIRSRCGPVGVTAFLPAYGRAGGAITDDTQMALFTAEGMIRALVRQVHHGTFVDPVELVRRSYLRWATTQGLPWPDPTFPEEEDDGWLVEVAELHVRRAPGTTCLSALSSGGHGTIDRPLNDSKGCGGAMRTAPIGFTSVDDPFRIGAECAALTHGHPSGYLSAGFIAELVARLVRGEALPAAIDATTATLRTYRGSEETERAVAAACELAARGRPSPEDLEGLGGAWVGEEAVAIALCCALVADDVRDGLQLAVTHSGDADSTGAIAGSILGVVHGEEGLPADLLADLELREVITQVTDDLVDAFHGEGVGEGWAPDPAAERWWARYPGY